MSLNPLLKSILVLLSGLFLSLSAPGFDFSFIAWFGLVPFFAAINTQKKIGSALLNAFLFGFGYNIFYLQWLFSLHPLNWLGFNNIQSYLLSFLSLFLVSTYNSLFFILFAACSYYLKKYSTNPYNKGIARLLLLGVLWLLIFNKLQACEFLLGFPWTLIEYSQYKNLFLIQIAEYVGSIGISFLIVLFNIVLSDFILHLISIEKISGRYLSKHPGQFEDIIKGFILSLLLISSSIIYGAYLYSKNQQFFTNKSESICILQGNLPIKVTRGGKIDIKLARKTYNNLITNNKASLITLPEGALPAVFNLDPVTINWLKTTAQIKHTDIIAGTYCRNKKGLTNCTVAYSPFTKKLSSYEKERLVPFGEFTPFKFLLPGFLNRFTNNVIGDGFIKGEQNQPLVTSIGNAGVNICFELIFPTLIRRHSINGANFLINLSDLSWFSRTLPKKQFLAFGVMRAVENRKPFIIVTNNGISAFIEPSGKIRNQSIPNTEGVLIDWINPNNKTTLYAKYGW